MKQLFYCLLTIFIFSACSSKNEFTKITADNHSGNASLTNGELTITGTGSLVSTQNKYKNFELTLECKTTPNAIGGIIFHTDNRKELSSGYEILINNNKGGNDWRKTGSLSSVRNFAKRCANNDTWFPIRLEVIGKQIKVYVNNFFVTDYTEPEKPYREEAFFKRLISKGSILLVNQSESPISFRNIQVKSLPDNLKSESAAVEEENDDIIRLQQKNFPTIDFHLHLKGEWTIGQATAQSRKLGITYGIAPNCGKNFPITDDQGVNHWLSVMKKEPVLLPMQAEGREWISMFSPEAYNKFDYRFTDAMTWTDHKGRRLRLWIPEETFIDNKQQFMDMLVERACGIISSEPINIYVNPTYIPEQLQPEYNQLWTKERMQKIIDACVKSNVAIEINNRYRIPSQAFIELAKANGAKFAFGTNNTSPNDVGKLEYSIEMIKACHLTKEDIFIPEN